MSAKNRWEVYDRYGTKIYMTAERWQHALEKRPWLVDYMEDVLATIKHGKRRQDALNVKKYRYYRACNRLEYCQLKNNAPSGRFVFTFLDSYNHSIVCLKQ